MADRKVKINKRKKGLSREDLENLSKTELVDKVIQLEAYNLQLKNILQKKLRADGARTASKLPDEICGTSSNSDAESISAEDSNLKEEPQLLSSAHELEADSSSNANASKKRKFDFTKCHKRHVLLKLLYFGWDYQGYASQEDSNATIEYQLFNALTRTCLIASRATSNYHRCGRTDKEVSAFCQVISIDLRSKYEPERQLNPELLATEIDYCSILNRVLPKNIQCIAWMPLRSHIYSARFDCSARTYRYYFPKGDLDLKAMSAACKLLERKADFRNFCKMDIHNGVTNFIRCIQRATLQLCPNELVDDRGYTMYFLEIKANSFLWHQIRCIMAVLFLIGQRKEQPEVVTELLDVDKNPCKPQYSPAIGLPLNLFHCDFREHTSSKMLESANSCEHTLNMSAGNIEHSKTETDTTLWVCNNDNLRKLIENLQSEWTQYSVKCTMIRNVLTSLEATLSSELKPEYVRAQALLLQEGVQPKQYQDLLSRKRCESLENRIEHFVKKQRLVFEFEDEGGSS